jgi:hypothetical protein
MSSAYENAMSDQQAENYTQTYPVTPYWMENGSMTNEQITNLIAARNAITDRTEDYQNLRAVSYIDAVLSDIPIGQRPDVDALLGRRPGYIVNPAVLLWPDEDSNPTTQQMLNMTARAFEEQEPIEY